MAKKITYRFLSCEINHGTQDAPDIEQVLLEKVAHCKTQAEFEANYPLVEQEAVPGSIEITGEFDPEELTDRERITQLEEALELLLSGVTE